MFAGIIGVLSLFMAIILGWFTVALIIANPWTAIPVGIIILAFYIQCCRMVARRSRHRIAARIATREALMPSTRRPRPLDGFEEA